MGAIIASTALVAASFFFWGRGMVKAGRNDLVAALIVFMVACLSCIASASSSAVFGRVGGIVLLFGVFTLVMSRFAKPECPLTRDERKLIGVAAIILGLSMGLIMGA
ncbi:MAG: hypothetical protein V1918_04295 [Planctomycetota bacterium]